MKRALLFFPLALVAQDPFKVAPDHYKLVFENPSVRVVRVIYGPHEKSPVHDHPANPTVYVYVTDGGPLHISHEGGPMVTRPVVKAGQVRFNHGMAEHHFMENMAGEASEYVRVELKTRPADLPEKDVRLAPDAAPFENGQIRISHLDCSQSCAAPAYPAVDVPIGVAKPKWLKPGEAETGGPLVRVELKTPPYSGRK